SSQTAGREPTTSGGGIVPTLGQVALALPNDAYAVVNMLWSGRDARRARPEGVEPPAGGFGDRGATGARARGIRMKRAPRWARRYRRCGNSKKLSSYQQMTTGLPVLAGSRRDSPRS